ncbi:MAG: YdcF family protein [Pseudomonadota bacterium]
MTELTIQDIAKFLINPLFPVFALLGLLLVKKKAGRKILAAIFLYLYLASTTLASHLFIHFWRVEDTLNPSLTYDAVVPLSGVADYKWYALGRKEILPVNCYYRFGSHIDRVIKAAELLMQGRARRLFFGEFNYTLFNEGELVRDFLLKQGINPEQIQLYGRVKNTRDEAVKCQQYAAEEGLQSLILVTSENHMRRAAALFKKQGLSPALVSVERAENEISPKDFVPGEKGLAATENMLYELVGYAGYFITGEL